MPFSLDIDIRELNFKRSWKSPFRTTLFKDDLDDYLGSHLEQ